MGSSCIAQGDQLSALWSPGGWEGDARGRGYEDICIHIADCYTAETNSIVKQLYSNKDVKKKKHNNLFLLLQNSSQYSYSRVSWIVHLFANHELNCQWSNS